MTTYFGRGAALLSAAIAGLTAVGHSMPAVTIAPQPSARRRMEIPTESGYGYGWNYRRGPGWTVAQVKRMAKKRRNQIRNRRAHKKARTA